MDAPDTGSAAVMNALNANTAKSRETVASEQKEMSPIIGKAQEALDSPAPKSPKLKPLPDAPKDSQGEDASAFIAASSLMAGIAGAFTRNHVTTALNAFGSAVKGLKKGQLDVAKQSMAEWKASSDKVIQDNDSLLKEYQGALADRKASTDDQLTKLQLIAAKYKDPLMQQAAEGKNIFAAAQLIDARERFGLSYKQNQEKIDASQKAVTDKIKAQLAGKGFKLDDEGKIVKMDPKDMPNQGLLTPEQLASSGPQAATGMPLTQIAPGYGATSTKVRQQLHDAAIASIMAENPDMSASEAGVELAKRTVQFQSGKVSVTSLNKMLGATKQAVSQLDFNIDKAKEQMARLDGSDISPVINAIARGEQKWTGDPAYSSLYFYMNAVATESARILAGGQASVAQLHAGAMEEAQKWAGINMTPAAFDDVAESMKAEGHMRLKTYEDAMKSQEIGGGGKPKPTPSDLEYVRAHPETKDKFINHFGVEP